MSTVAPTFNGFEPANTTPVPDVLFDELLPYLNEAQLKVLLYIVRRTLGFKKTTDAISLKQFRFGIVTKDKKRLDQGCGLKNFTSITKALNSLENMQCIERDKKESAEGDSATTVYRIHFKGTTANVVPTTDNVVGVLQQTHDRTTQSVVGVLREKEPQETVIQQTDSQETVIQERETRTSTPDVQTFVAERNTPSQSSSPQIEPPSEREKFAAWQARPSVTFDDLVKGQNTQTDHLGTQSAGYPHVEPSEHTDQTIARNPDGETHTNEVPIAPPTVQPTRRPRKKPDALALDEVTQKRVDSVFEALDDLKRQVMENPKVRYARPETDKARIATLLETEEPTQEGLSWVYMSMWNEPKDTRTGFCWREHMRIENVCKQYPTRIMTMPKKPKNSSTAQVTPIHANTPTVSGRQRLTIPEEDVFMFASSSVKRGSR